MKSLVFCSVIAALALPGAVQGAEPLPIKGIRSIGITVSDIDAALGFYSKAVPYTVVKRFRIDAARLGKALLGAPHREVEIALVQMPNMFIQLMDFTPGKAAPPSERPVFGPGYTHICFQSPATDSADARFRKAGLKMVSRGDSPVDIGGYGVVYAYGRDPDGTMIENEVLTSPTRSDRVWVSHIANVTHDRGAMLGFYERLLGYPPYRRAEQANRKPLDDIADIDGLALKGGWFSVGNMEIEIWEYTRPATPMPNGDRKLDQLGYNSINFEVADVAKERRRLQQSGIRLAGPVRVINGWKVQFAHDPDGNIFSVQQNVGGNAAESIDAHTGAYPPKRN